MNEKLPFLPSKRCLVGMSGASAAFLLAGSAQGAVQLVPVGTTLTGDGNGSIFAIRMNSLGVVTHQTLSSSSAFVNFVNANATDAILGIGAFTDTMGDYVQARVDHAGFVRVGGGDFAALLVSSFGNIGAVMPVPLAWRFSAQNIAKTWTSTSLWPSGGAMGFQLTPQGTTDTYYGYVWMTIASDVSSATILGYGWEDSGAPIHPYSMSSGGSGSGSTGGASPAGGTPEPAASGLALLALGAAGVMRQRRRQAE